MQALEKERKLPLTGWQQEVDQAKRFGLEAAESIVDRNISTFSRGELPHFAGINTFMKAPYLEDVNQVGNYDVAIVGVPHDCGTTLCHRSSWQGWTIGKKSQPHGSFRK